VTVASTERAPRDTRVITDRQDALDAIVHAIVHGDHATSQHIVDTLGARARPTSSHEGTCLMGTLDPDAFRDNWTKRVDPPADPGDASPDSEKT
jgi:hypothetical protein